MSNLFGRKVKHKRKLLRLSLQDLANKTHKSKAHIYEIEEGKSNPKIATLIKIAEALNIPILYLIDDKYNIGTYPHEPHYCEYCEKVEKIFDILT